MLQNGPQKPSNTKFIDSYWRTKKVCFWLRQDMKGLEA